MKDFICGVFAFVVVVALVISIIAFCGWITSLLLNVVFGQLGLGKITVWGGCCVLGTAQVIKEFINW